MPMQIIDKVCVTKFVLVLKVNEVCYKCLFVNTGGYSKYVCLYHVDQQILLKRFEISHNLSFDGMEVRSCCQHSSRFHHKSLCLDSSNLLVSESRLKHF